MSLDSLYLLLSTLILVQEAYNERIERVTREYLSDPIHPHPGEYGTAVDSVGEEDQSDWDTSN